jgi:phosphoenolpyruvate carboxylase
LNRDDIHFPPHHAPLREDIHALGEIVGSVLREQGGDELYELAEGDRRAAIRRREGTAAAAEALRVRVEGRQPQLARDLVRAFSSYFQLANVAEKVHRIRRRREYFLADSDRPQPLGVLDTLAELKAQGLKLPEVLQLLRQLSIEPVLVAHPTESARRTGLRGSSASPIACWMKQSAAGAPGEGGAAGAHPRRCDHRLADRRASARSADRGRSRERDLLSRSALPDIPVFYEELAAALARLYGAAAEML